MKSPILERQVSYLHKSQNRDRDQFSDTRSKQSQNSFFGLPSYLQGSQYSGNTKVIKDINGYVLGKKSHITDAFKEVIASQKDKIDQFKEKLNMHNMELKARDDVIYALQNENEKYQK